MYNIVGVSDSKINSALEGEFGGAGDSGERLAIAQDGLRIASDFIKRQPVGWNVNSKKRHFRRSCRTYMMNNLKPTPKGFISSFIFSWVVSYIIGWVIRYIMAEVFPENDIDKE